MSYQLMIIFSLHVVLEMASVNIYRLYNRNLHIAPHEVLTQWDRDKMAAIIQTTFSNAFF